jgi:hypothetical protein
MEKTYTEKVHYKIIIEGDYVRENLLEEELCDSAEEMHDLVLDYLGDDTCVLFSEHCVEKIFSNHEKIVENP